jgi:hypothetical protein
MYLAEIQGKLSLYNERREDLLTSNVFSFFKYAPRDVFLYHLLKSIDIPVTEEEAVGAEFNFWPRYENNTEPDLGIIVGEYYLLFEAKYFSGFGQEIGETKHQLIREIEGGILEAGNLGKTFKLIAVTADYHFDFVKYKDIPAKVRLRFKWTNWQQIALLIYEILESDVELSTEVRSFAEDLYALLLKKNLRTYAGMNVLARVGQLSDSPDSVFFEASTAKYRGDFIGFMASLSVEEDIAMIPKQIFFNPSITLFQSLVQVPSLKPSPSPLFFEGDLK